MRSARGQQGGGAAVVTERPVPAGVTYGHTKSATTGEMAPVVNEDIATFTGTFANGAAGTFSASGVAHRLPDGLGVADLFAYQARAFIDQIAGTGDPLPPFADGLHGLKIVEAVSESARNGGAATKII